MFSKKTTDTSGETAETVEKKQKKVRERKPMDGHRKLSIVCGVCVAVTVGAVGFSAVQYTQASDLMAEIDASTVEVLVPSADIPAGTAITAENLVMAKVPKTYIPQDAAKKKKDISGLTALTDLTAGIPIDLSCVSASKTPAGVTSAVRSGYVAKMVALDVAPGLSPMLAPGDYVTVSGLVDKEVISYRNIRVVALDGSFSAPRGTAYTTVTLELTPEQADALLGAAISLTAESAEDHIVTDDIAPVDEVAPVDQTTEEDVDAQ